MIIESVGIGTLTKSDCRLRGQVSEWSQKMFWEVDGENRGQAQITAVIFGDDGIVVPFTQKTYRMVRPSESTRFDGRCTGSASQGLPPLKASLEDLRRERMPDISLRRPQEERD